MEDGQQAMLVRGVVTEVGTSQTTSDPPLAGQNSSLVLDILIEYLGEIFVAILKDDRTLQWPDDLRDRPCRTRYSFEDISYTDLFSFIISRHRCPALFALQAINFVDRRAHLSARRMLGYSLAFDFNYKTRKSYMDNFHLLDDHTSMLVIRDCHYPLDDEHRERRTTFLKVLNQKSPSLRVLELNFNDAARAKETLRALLESISGVEELCLSFDVGVAGLHTVRDMFESRQTDSKVSDTDERMPECNMLHTIRLQHFDVSIPLKTHRGLPVEFSSLLRFKSLKKFHLYNPFAFRSPTREDALQCLRKLTWSRDKAEKDFIFESVWLREMSYRGAMPEHYCQFLSTAPHMTMTVVNYAAFSYGQIISQVCTSPQTMTLFSNDFPSIELLLRLPSSLDHLTIRIQVECCKSDPQFWDEWLCEFVEAKGPKVLRFGIGANHFVRDEKSEGKDEDEDEDKLRLKLFLSQPDSSHFVRTRDACNARGYQFILENMWKDYNKSIASESS